MPTPATTLPSDRSEMPKSLAAPATSASTSPAPFHHCVPVPMPWVDLNQNSIENVAGDLAGDRRVVVHAVEGRRGVGVAGDRAGVTRA